MPLRHPRHRPARPGVRYDDAGVPVPGKKSSATRARRPGLLRDPSELEIRCSNFRELGYARRSSSTPEPCSASRRPSCSTSASSASPTSPRRPLDGAAAATCPTGTTATGFREFYLGDTAKPRLSIGFGVNWNSPFGPFRIDIAKALIKADGDDTKLITFNVGTAF